jgi:hypothetical protein
MYARTQYPDHDCMDNLMEPMDDPYLPPYIEKYECGICGQWFELDTETGEYTVDN